MTIERFARELVGLRKDLELNQAEAAKVCKVSLRTWVSWEKAQGNPLYPTMIGALQILRECQAKRGGGS